MNKKQKEFRQFFQSKTNEERVDLIKSLSKKEVRQLYNCPDIFLFDKQIIEGNERYTILRCGRRFGKTVAGSAWVAKKILAGAKCLGLCGPTHEDVVKVMVPALKSWFPYPLNYNSQLHTVTGFENNAIVHCFTSDTEVRGYGLEYLWCDEIAKWADGIPEKVEERFKVLDMAVSAGDNPQTIITSTPKEFPLFFKWQKKVEEHNPNYKMLTGTMFDNPFLSEKYKQSQLEEFGNSRFGRQELYGELLQDVEGAAWNYEMIDNSRITLSQFDEMLKEPNFIRRIVIGVDPTVSDKPDNDECGIITAALGSNDHIYILKDDSGQYTTSEWARQAIKSFQQYKAGLIVIEKNNGGELVKTNIHAINNNIPVKTITATKGKIDRALPVASLYERGLVHHVGMFSKLEDQMVKYTGNPKQKSPDRLDALVWACYELKLADLRNPPARGTISLGDW